MPPPSLSKMRERVHRHGLMRDNKYEIRITRPIGPWDNTASPDAELLQIYATNVDLPGVSFIPGDYKPQGFGILERRPTEATVNDMNATMLVDADAKILKFLQDWMGNTIVFDPRDENYATAEFYSAVHYKSNYVTDIEVVIPSANGETDVLLWHGVDCWPSTLNTLALSDDANNEIARVALVFQLKTWWSDSLV